MTILIAATFPGGVMAAADSRSSQALGPGVFGDDTNKHAIVQGQTIMAFGVQYVTEISLNEILQLRPPFDGDTLLAAMKEGLSRAWSVMLPKFAPDVDLSASTMRAGLVVAGIDAVGCYIGGCMSTAQGAHVPTGPVRGDLQRIVLGSEAHGATDHFDRQVESALSKVAGVGLPDLEIGMMMAEAAAATIRAMSLLDRTVGGPIRYRIQLLTGDCAMGSL